VGVTLVPYSAEWNRDFEKIREDILACAGGSIVSVEHIGSTAIPGMVSKDVIDVQVGVASFDGVEALCEVLGRNGFELLPHVRQDHAPGHEFEEFVPGYEKRFLKASSGRRSAHIHVRKASAPNFEFALLFRDYLRKNSEAARAYEQLKVRLAKAVGDDLKAYALIKDPVCDLIFMLAKTG
jgi:dephospho-CoA kinase